MTLAAQFRMSLAIVVWWLRCATASLQVFSQMLQKQGVPIMTEFTLSIHFAGLKKSDFSQLPVSWFSTISFWCKGSCGQDHRYCWSNQFMDNVSIRSCHPGWVQLNVAMFGSLAIESQKQLPRVGQNSSLRLGALVRKPWFFTLTSVWHGVEFDWFATS